MATWKKIIIGVFAIVVALIAIFIGLLTYLFGGMCGSDSYRSVVSPNGKYKAVIYEFDCGATTSFSTQISILGANDPLEAEAGNIFTSEGRPEEVAPEVTWVSDSILNVHKRAAAEVHNQENVWGWPWNRIKVTYN